MIKKILIIIIFISGIFFLLKRYELKKIDLSKPIETIYAETLITDPEEGTTKAKIAGEVDEHPKSHESEKLDSNKQDTTTPISNFQPNKLDIFFGNKDSKIQLVEYFSFTCHHCYHYHENIFPEIKKKYIDSNKIGYILREFIGSKQDLDAAILARCKGDASNFIHFQNILLKNQTGWAYNSGYREALKFIGKVGGVSEEEFTKCLANSDLISILIANTRFAAAQPRFTGTPTIFVNGQQIMVHSFEKISELLEKELSKNY